MFLEIAARSRPETSLDTEANLRYNACLTGTVASSWNDIATPGTAVLAETDSDVKRWSLRSKLTGWSL
jgi:hypothetical protein